jgi:hypothetical protein
MPELNWNTLVPGTKYRVEFADCCAVGFFEDTFVEKEVEDDEDDDSVNALLFEHARIEQNWGPYRFREIIDA